MNNHRQSIPIRKAQSGFLVVLVLAILGLFGALGALQVLIHASAGLSSRALEHRRQRLTITLRAQRVLGEALLSLREVGSNRTDALEPVVAEKIAELDTGHAKLLVESCPAVIPMPVAFPNLNQEFDPLLAPSAQMLGLASPELRGLMGSRVAEYAAGRTIFTCETPVMGRTLRISLAFEGHLIAVPLTRVAKMAYELPGELGALPEADASVQVSGSLGLVPSRDAASIGSTQAVSDALPYHFRRKASIAAAYEYLFSQSSVERLALYAGPAHILDLDQEPTDIPRLDGYSRTAEVVELDLGVMGRGRWGSIDCVKPVVMVSSGKEGIVLKLRDSAPAVQRQPMVLVLMGTAKTPFLVEISSVSRPVILLGFNLLLRATAETNWSGALFLDPRCSLSVGQGVVHVAHFSYAAGATQVAASSVVADLPLNSALEQMAPRVIHAAVAPVVL